MASTRLSVHLPSENLSTDIQYDQLDEQIELQLSANSITNNGHHQQEFSLPPADGGKDAWLFLVTCFFVEAFVWGFPFSYGIFEEYYSTHEPFAGKSGIPAVGSSALVGYPSFYSIALHSYTDFLRVSCIWVHHSCLCYFNDGRTFGDRVAVWALV